MRQRHATLDAILWHAEPDDPFTDFEAERAHEVLLNDGNPPPECLDIDDEDRQDRAANAALLDSIEQIDDIERFGDLFIVIGPEPQFPPLSLVA